MKFACLLYDPETYTDLVMSMPGVQVGFFAEAGPLQIFVSGHLIPDDFDFDQSDEPAFVSADEEVRIQQGTEVRLRIVGTRTDANEIVSSIWTCKAFQGQFRQFQASRS